MKILTIDIGTGTQDIFLYDSNLDLENGIKLILPSPTMIVRRQLQRATRQRRPVVLEGVLMGGGPAAWAAEDHARAGLPIFATPEAARTLNDDLEAVQRSGITLISPEESHRLPPETVHIHMADFDFQAIARVLANFEVSLADLAAVAVAVFDHGDAPPAVSDRKFRFDYLDQRIRSTNKLEAFAYPADQIPPILTRLKAVARSADTLSVPLVVMDTAPAAVLGAAFDPRAAARERVMIANVGNFHTLAFRLGPQGIEGIFEHHTGLLDRPRLELLLGQLAAGTLTNAEVFNSQGHGALIYASEPLPMDHPDFNLVVTGPRRSMLAGSALLPYFAVPFGDMMIAGCFGLLSATAACLPELAGPILKSLHATTGSNIAPWDASD
jgi:uncharacterized protein (DUF1786 family)